MYKSIGPLFYYRLSYNIKLVIVIIFKLYSLDNLKLLCYFAFKNIFTI